MNRYGIIPSMLCCLWAGVSLGGALVAAPAKFQAPSLTIETALEVGRAQFTWLGYTEWVLLMGLFVSLWSSRTIIDARYFLIPIALFLVQQVGLMPGLDAVTVARIEGQTGSSGSLHIIYVVFEIVKFLTLLFAAAKSLQTIKV